MITKDQIIELFKLFLTTSQAQYEEVKDDISLSDEQFVNVEFEIMADESKKELWTNSLNWYPSYFRKKAASGPENLFCLRENNNFQAIAAQWQTTASIFNATDALEQFCRGVAAEHRAIYGLLHPSSQSFFEKFADGMLHAVQHGSYPVHCLVFLRDLWVDMPYTIEKPFQFLEKAIPSIRIRRPSSDDYEKSRDWGKTLFCEGIQHLQIRIGRQAAVGEFFWYDKEPIKFLNRLSPSIRFQVFQQSLDTLFLLIGNASVRTTEFRYTFGCSGGPNSIFDSSPGRCVSMSKLDKKLKWAGELMLPYLMHEKQENDTITRSLKYYQDSLFRSLGIESRIALSISGLEAIYSNGVQGEITLRLSLRVAKLLSYLGINPLAVKKNLSKAYSVRSSHVHGSDVKKSEYQALIELSENIDEYLRLSILIFQYCLACNHLIKDVIDELDVAYFSDVFSEDISHILNDAKNILYS